MRKSVLNAIFVSSLKLVLILFTALPINLVYPQEKKVPYKKPAVGDIEKSLFKLINKEREQQALPSLVLSKELSSLARKHSRDMSSGEKISHVSISGKSYIDRLLNGKFYFISGGENVASSDSFLAEFIHQKLMESPEHRSNIIEPSYDTVGIGVTQEKDKKYYVTQDFLQAFEPKREEEIKVEIQKIIDEIRKKNSLVPLVYLEEPDKFARTLSERKAKAQPLPGFPKIFGETHATFLTTPTISETNFVFEEIISSIYETGGLGVWVARNKEYPGGAYFITLLLFPKNIYKNLSEEELRKIVLQEMNKIRAKKGILDLNLDNRLSEEAKKISLLITTEKGKKFVTSLEFNKNVISYTAEGPYVLPRELQEQIESRKFKKIGIGILFGMTPKYPKGTFWVTIIFER